MHPAGSGRPWTSQRIVEKGCLSQHSVKESMHLDQLPVLKTKNFAICLVISDTGFGLAASFHNSDNTLIIYVAGDNGPSAEGSLTGTTNNMMTQNGLPDNVVPVLEHPCR